MQILWNAALLALLHFAEAVSIEESTMGRFLRSLYSIITIAIGIPPSIRYAIPADNELHGHHTIDRKQTALQFTACPSIASSPCEQCGTIPGLVFPPPSLLTRQTGSAVLLLTSSRSTTSDIPSHPLVGGPISALLPTKSTVAEASIVILEVERWQRHQCAHEQTI